MALAVPSNAGFISVDTSLGKTFELPLSTELIGRVITFKDSTGNAASGPIQIETQGGDLFENGTTTYIIQEAYGSATFVSRSGYWVLQQGNKQVIASSVNAYDVTGYYVQTPFTLSSLQHFTDNEFVKNSLAVTDGALSAVNSTFTFPFNLVLETKGSNDVNFVYGMNELGVWINRMTANDSHFGIGLYQSPTEVLTLLSTGKVGIGTSSPQFELQINGTAFVSTLQLSSLQMIDVTTNLTNYLTTSSGILLLNGAGITGGGGGAGVAQILAGSNISISPLGGTGVVTINASGGLSISDLLSTTTGLGTLGYVSTQSLISTTEGMIFAVIDLINNLGNYGYLSTTQLNSTIEGLGSSGYLSTNGQGLFSSLYVNLAPQDAPVWNSNFPIAGFDPEPNPLAVDVFGSARILKNLYIGSTTTILGTGGMSSSNVYTNRVSAGTTIVSSLGFFDGLTESIYYLQASNGGLIFNTSAVGSGDIGSTIQGLGSSGYVSTLTLVSSINGSLSSFSTALGPGGITTATLNSSFTGLGTLGYISSAALRSTFQHLGQTYISTQSLLSTTAGLGRIYVSTSGLQANLSTFSTSIGRLFTTSNATISSLTASNAVMSNLIVSTITFDTGDGFIDFPDIRALSLSTFLINTSTINVGYLVSTQVLEVSSIVGITFLSGSNLVSTTSGLQREFNTAGFLSTASLFSTTGGLQREFNTAGFLSSPSLLSTTQGLGSVGYLSSLTGFRVSTGFVTASTLNLIDPYLGGQDFLTVSSGTLLLNGSFITGGAGGAGVSQILAGANITIDPINGTGAVTITGTSPTAFDLTSSLIGLGSIGYISSLSLFSSVNAMDLKFATAGFLSSANLLSTTGGLQREFNTAGFLSSLNLLSSVTGLGQIYMSTPSVNSSITSYLSSFSTAVGPVSAGGLANIPANLSTQAIFTSSLRASTITASTLFTSSITGSLSQFALLSSLSLNVSSFFTATRQATPLFITF